MASLLHFDPDPEKRAQVRKILTGHLVEPVRDEKELLYILRNIRFEIAIVYNNYMIALKLMHRGMKVIYVTDERRPLPVNPNIHLLLLDDIGNLTTLVQTLLKESENGHRLVQP